MKFQLKIEKLLPSHEHIERNLLIVIFSKHKATQRFESFFLTKSLLLFLPSKILEETKEEEKKQKLHQPAK